MLLEWSAALLLVGISTTLAKDDDCPRPAYLSRLPQRLQGEVLEIWTDPEPETTLTYADEPVIFKPSCEWRMTRTGTLISKLTRAEYYTVFTHRVNPPARTSARVTATRRPLLTRLPLSRRPFARISSPPPPRYSTSSIKQRPSGAPLYPSRQRPTASPRRTALQRKGYGYRNRATVVRPCRPHASVARFPPKVQARIKDIWNRHRPGMSCAEMHRKTKQIIVNLPIQLRRIVHPPQLECKLPHFLSRLQPALQNKLRAVWVGHKQGAPCQDRVRKQLDILAANEISIESFRMPSPALYNDDDSRKSRSSQTI